MSDATAVFRASIDLLTERRMADYVALFDETAVVEYGFPPSGWPARLTGRQEIADALLHFPDILRIQYARDVMIHETTDREVVVEELILGGEVTATGEPYESRYIEVVRVRDGRIIQFRDYWNPELATALMPTGHFPA